MNKTENQIDQYADEKEMKMKTSVFFIEANSYEQLMLWKEFKKETNWEEDGCGFTQVIGFIGGDENMPVNVSFFFAKVWGKRICFFDVCSRFSDSEMVMEWIKKNYPVKYDNLQRWAIKNAMNFPNESDVTDAKNIIGKNYFDDLEKWENSFYCNECGCDKITDFAYDRTVSNGEVWHCKHCKTETNVSDKPNEDNY